MKNNYKAPEFDGECTRKRVVIDGEHYYIILGMDWVQVTVPRENDQAMDHTRTVAETLCREITELMKNGH